MGIKLLTTEDVAQSCHTTPSTVRGWRFRKFGPPGVRVGRRVLYREDDVVRWLQDLQTEQQPTRTVGGAAA